MAGITLKFLEKALGHPISHFVLNSGSNLGDNYTSLLYSIDVFFAEPTKVSQHILLKCFPVDQARQQFLMTANLFHKELLVYNTMLVEFVNFQKNYFKSINRVGCVIRPPVPDFVYGRAVDYNSKDVAESKSCLDPLENCIIMPDLRKTANFRMANRLKGFELDHCSLVIKALAKFHGISWAYKVRSRVTCLVDKFPFLSGTFFDVMEDEFINGFYDNSSALFRHAIETRAKNGDEKSRLIGALERGTNTAVDVANLYFADGRRLSDPSITADNILRVPLEPRVDEEPWLVAVHGDSWPNNYLFRYEDEGRRSGRPLEVILVDLQMTREGSPLTDLAYSIYTCTTATFRRDHLNDLLSLYFESFTEICDHFDVDTLPGFTLPELKRRFHKSKAFGFVMALGGFPIFLNGPENAKDFEISEDEEVDSFVSRMKNMANSVKNNSTFQHRVIDIVSDLYKDGII